MTAKPKKILLTGASGFVGRAMLEALAHRGLNVRAVSRSSSREATPLLEWARGDLTVPAGWDRLLDGIDVVVHLAGNPGRGSEDEMMRANADATAMLAKAAAKAGVRRFVYASTIRVYGHQGRIDAATKPMPADAYGRSKLAAETALMDELPTAGPACSILRPPFVYGADRAGLLSALSLAARYRVPLPLAALRNRRSLVYVGNLADLLAVAALEPVDRGGYRLPASEGLDLTYGELFKRIGEAIGRRTYTFPAPEKSLRLVAGLLLSREAVGRMLEECVVDGSQLAQRLDWTPPIPAAQALRTFALRR